MKHSLKKTSLDIFLGELNKWCETKNTRDSAQTFDAAIFIFSDNQTEIPTIFELGLMTGSLGHSKVFIIYTQNNKRSLEFDSHIPYKTYFLDVEAESAMSISEGIRKTLTTHFSNNSSNELNSGMFRLPSPIRLIK